MPDEETAAVAAAEPSALEMRATINALTKAIERLTVIADDIAAMLDKAMDDPPAASRPVGPAGGASRGASVDRDSAIDDAPAIIERDAHGNKIGRGPIDIAAPGTLTEEPSAAPIIERDAHGNKVRAAIDGPQTSNR